MFASGWDEGSSVGSSSIGICCRGTLSWFESHHLMHLLPPPFLVQFLVLNQNRKKYHIDWIWLIQNNQGPDWSKRGRWEKWNNQKKKKTEAFVHCHLLGDAASASAGDSGHLGDGCKFPQVIEFLYLSLLRSGLVGFSHFLPNKISLYKI